MLLDPEFLEKLERLELTSRKLVRGNLVGHRQSKRKGQGIEYSDFRNYSLGDDLRFVDWNLYARLDKLFLKLYQDEEDLQFYTLIDNSLSMAFGQPSKLDYAKKLAAALGFIGICRTDQVRIEPLWQVGSIQTSVFRGRASLWQMLQALDSISYSPAQSPADESLLADAIKRFLLTSRNKGVLILLTDLMDKNGYEAAIKLLACRNLDVHILHILSPEEMNPELHGDLRLVDCEDSQHIDVSIDGPTLQQYKNTLNDFVDSARRFCSQREVNYLLVDTMLPVERLVTKYLRQRGLVQ